MKPNLIIFVQENVENDYADFKNKLKPKVKWYNNNLTSDECRRMKQIRESIMKEIEKIIFDKILYEADENASASEEEWFPNTKIMTGNYYVGYETYNKDDRGYQIILCIRMTCLEDGQEEDYYGIDFSVEFDSLEENPEIEILGTSVI